MSKTYRIFGYGSLINESSLRDTVPNAKIIFPARLKGFVRVFNTKSTTRFGEPRHKPICVVNLEMSEGNDVVNGICFEVSDDYFQDLLKREGAYELVQTEVSSFHNDADVTKCYFFRAAKEEAYPYQQNFHEQDEYLDICLGGASDFGKEFLAEFKDTTFIGKKTLKELGH